MRTWLMAAVALAAAVLAVAAPARAATFVSLPTPVLSQDVGVPWLASYISRHRGTGIVAIGNYSPLTGCVAGDLNDGCLTAPAGAQIQFPNFFTSAGALESGQVWAITPANDSSPWDVSCVTYKCGPLHPQASAGDPAAAGNIPSACGKSLVGTSPTDYVQIDCSGAGPFSFTDLDLSRAFGHGPTFYVFHNTTSVSVNFDDIWFVQGADCTAGPGTLISFQNTTSASIHIGDMYFDGNDPTCRFAAPLNPLNLFTSASTIVERSAFRHVDGRVVNFRGGDSANSEFRYSLIDGFSYGAWMGHGEIGLIDTAPGATAFGSMKYRYDAFNYTGNACRCGTSTIFLTNGTNGTFGDITFDHLAFATNINGGAPLTPGVQSGSLTFHIDADPATGFHNRLTVDSIPSGQRVDVGTQLSGSGFGGNTMVRLTGTGGTGSTFTVACFVPTNIFNCPGGSVIPSGYQMEIPSANLGSSGSPISGTWDSGVAGVACFTTGGFLYHSITVSHVLCDTTGQQVGGGAFTDFGNLQANFTGSISGTTLTVTAVSLGALAPGHWVTGAGIISGNLVIVSQLTGTTGSTGTYSLNNSATISSEALSSGPPNCTVPTSWIDVHNPVTGAAFTAFTTSNVPHSC